MIIEPIYSSRGEVQTNVIEASQRGSIDISDPVIRN